MNRVSWLLLCVLFSAASVQAAETVHIQVIWGTDKDKPAGSHYRQIGPKLAARVSPVFRWKHFWEIERKKVQIDRKQVTKIQLANHRSLEIEHLRSGELEVRLFRRSGLVTKCRQPALGRMAILGGEESSKDSFFVVVRPDEPVNGE
jgi:hypothetical protein